MFALQMSDRSKEAMAIGYYNVMDRVGLKHFRRPADVPADAIPVGSVEWTLAITGWSVVPDYYPEFLKPYLGRNVWKADRWPIEKDVFVKPADKHKRFTGKVTVGGMHGRKKGPFWCSDKVVFLNEWRLYVADGKTLYIGWYDGLDSDSLPNLDIVWPEGYCGAVDFGETLSGQLLLVEANEPFACGWYGHINEGSIYGRWLEAGFNYMKKTYGHI
jgi:hypothetical protein